VEPNLDEEKKVSGVTRLTMRKRSASLVVTGVTAMSACLSAGLLAQNAQAVTAPHAPAQALAHAPANARTVADFTGLTHRQRVKLMGIARKTWKFYGDDVDPATHLPLDNLTYAGGSKTPTDYGRYTSSANIGVYLWAVVSAQDLGLITKRQATHKVRATLRSVKALSRYKGFLHQWYDTSTGDVILNPGQGVCPATTGTFDNCSFVSNVDNGWYASGLLVARQALPGASKIANRLLKPMDFSIFYDGRAQTHCNVNSAIEDDPPTGQMWGGYYIGLPPPDTASTPSHYYHNGALYSDPRISAYIGMGLHQMPGDVWWRSWRELPPPAPSTDCQTTDPDFSWQGQWPMKGKWKTITDPQSHQQFPVWEGHYTYPGSKLKFIPTYNGGMFEGLMANNVVPETSWGTHGFGLADKRLAEVQIKYTKQQLHFPVWGMSPSSTADDSGGYGGFGVAGLKFPYHADGGTKDAPNEMLAQCQNCAQETVVTPHASFIALDVVPQRAYKNITKLRSLYPDIYGSRGFFDAVDPATGVVGHRILVLDQSMIMASLDNALRNRALQRHFAADPVSKLAHTYLSMEHMTLG
jgi:Putative glucoamylase/Protein of unknown function (DUF3131)